MTFGERAPAVVTKAPTWAQKVAVARGLPNITNTAVPGREQMKSHWSADLATHKPSAAVIMMSAHDATHYIYVDGTYLAGYAKLERDMMQELAGLPVVQFVDGFSA